MRDRSTRVFWAAGVPAAITALAATAFAVTSCSDAKAPTAPQAANATRSPLPDGASLSAVPPTEHHYPNAQIAALAARVRAAPGFQERLARQQRIAAEGNLPIAVTDTPLPAGGLAIVRLGQSGVPRHYVVMYRAMVSDAAYQHALLAALHYRMTVDDNSPVTLTLYNNGRVDIASTAFGRRSMSSRVLARHQASPDQASPNAQTASAIARLAAAAPQRIPGFNAVKFVTPGTVEAPR